jgi:hypothetical protein
MSPTNVRVIKVRPDVKNPAVGRFRHVRWAGYGLELEFQIRPIRYAAEAIVACQPGRRSRFAVVTRLGISLIRTRRNCR